MATFLLTLSSAVELEYRLVRARVWTIALPNNPGNAETV